MNKLQKTIKIFVADRLNDNFMRLTKNKKYLEKRKYFNDCIEKLDENFTIKEFEKYREIQNELFYQELQEAYKLGFKDCIDIF